MNIFLSYALADKKWAEDLASLLRNEGLFVNQGLGNVRAGEGWELILRQTLDSAELVISVLTAHALRTPQVLFELGAAIGAHKPFISLLVGTNEESMHAPFDLNEYQSFKVESPSRSC